jgi:hypothetical protein
MIKRSLKFFATLCLILLFAGGTFAQGQLFAPTQTIALSILGTETLSATCTPVTVTFASAAGTTVPGNAPVSCAVAWNLSPTRTSITSAVGFATAASALTNGANLIPSSAVSVSLNSGAVVPCSSTLTVATAIGAGGACGTGNVTALTNNFNSTKTDSFAISIAEPTPLAAGQWSGNLLIIYFAT